jgi:hypothetical protein
MLRRAQKRTRPPLFAVISLRSIPAFVRLQRSHFYLFAQLFNDGIDVHLAEWATFATAHFFTSHPAKHPPTSQKMSDSKKIRSHRIAFAGHLLDGQGFIRSKFDALETACIGLNRQNPFRACFRRVKSGDFSMLIAL